MVGVSVAGAINAGVTVYGYSMASSTIANSTNGTITEIVATLTGDKIYDALTGLIGTQILVTGRTAAGAIETLGYIGTPVASDANVLTLNKYVSGITSLANGTGPSAGLASNYILPSQLSSNDHNTVTIRPATVILTASKTYDGNTTLSESQLTLTGVTAGATTQTLTYTGTPVLSDPNVATPNKMVQGLTALTNAIDGSGGIASNYVLPSQVVSTANNNVTIGKADLTLSGSKVYNGLTSFAGLNLTATGVNSESFAISGLGDSTNLMSANVQPIGLLNSVVGLTVGSTNGTNPGIASNYNALTTVDSAVSVTKATAVIAGGKVYDGNTGLSTSQVSVTGVMVGGVTQTFTYTGTPVLFDANVATIGNYVMGVTGFGNSVDGSGGLVSNYNLASSTVANSNNRVSLARATAILAATKTYDGTLDLNHDQLTITGLTVNGVAQVLRWFGTAQVADKNVATLNNYVNTTLMTIADGGSGSSTGIATNYALPASVSAAGVNTAVISPAPLTLSATKIYDGSANLSDDVLITTNVRVMNVTETLSYTGAFANNANVAITDKFITSITLANATDGSGGLLSNYAVPVLSPATAPVTINPAALTSVTGTKIYDGYNTFSGALLTISGLNGDTFFATGNAVMLTKNVQTATPLATATGLILAGVAGAQSSNYQSVDPAAARVSVTPLGVVLTAPVINKVYDGGFNYLMTATDLTNMSAQLVGVDTISAATVVFAGSNPNVGTNKLVNLLSATISDGNNGRNYSATLSSSNTSNIVPAPLTVTAVSDAKFANQTDSQGFANNCGTGIICTGNYMGVIYTGFVNGESAATAVNNFGLVTRTNPLVNAAGVYAGVLNPSGYSASNYDISYARGTYSVIAPQNLLVKVIPLTTYYGSPQTYSTSNVTAQYLAADGLTIVSLIPTFTSVVSVNDGLGSTASFGLAPVNTTYSGSNNVVVGGYNLAAVNPLLSGVNFQTLTTVGSTTVNTRVLAATDIGFSDVSKVYDGNITISGLTLTVNPAVSQLIPGDAVVVKGTGTYADRNVGTDKLVSINISLSGNDSGNYALSSTSLQTGVNTTSSGTISQLPSVTWVGPSSGGNWSTQGNWENGATPLMNNVGQAIIPSGMNVIYDSAVVGAIGSSIVSNGSVVFAGSANFNLINNVSGTGSITLTGTGITTLSGNNTYSGGTMINNSALIAGSNQALGTGPIISNGGSLTLAAGVSLPSLTINGAITLASDIRTSGAQLYNGAVTFAAGQAVGGVITPMQITTNNSDITFNSTLVGSVNSLAQLQSLTINAGTGQVTFGDYVGAVNSTLGAFLSRTSDLSPYQLVVNGNTIIVKGEITTFGTQTYNGNLLIGDNGSNGLTRTLLSEDPSITINGTVNDLVSGKHNLVLRAITLDGSQIPAVALNSSVGLTSPLATLIVATGRQDLSLTSDFSAIGLDPLTFIGQISITGSISTMGDQSYTANSMLLGAGIPDATLVFTTTGNGVIAFNLGVEANGGGVALAAGSTGLTVGYTPSTYSVAPKTLVSLSAANIEYKSIPAVTPDPGGGGTGGGGAGGGGSGGVSSGGSSSIPSSGDGGGTAVGTPLPFISDLGRLDNSEPKNLVSDRLSGFAMDSGFLSSMLADNQSQINQKDSSLVCTYEGDVNVEQTAIQDPENIENSNIISSTLSNDGKDITTDVDQKSLKDTKYKNNC